MEKLSDARALAALAIFFAFFVAVQHPTGGAAASQGASGAGSLPEGFVRLRDVAPDIIQDIRYYGTDNFVGARIDSYNAPEAILTAGAAAALASAADALADRGYVIKIFDAYRPESATAHFVRWARDPGDARNKGRFYPDVDKAELFKRGYVARRSAHSRGSAVDVTLADARTGREADMGSAFDFFGDISRHGTKKISREQAANRRTLRRAMEDAGFRAISSEWWHYSLASEPFPDRYFDFPIDGPNPGVGAALAEALGKLCGPSGTAMTDKLVAVTAAPGSSIARVTAFERTDGTWARRLSADGFVGVRGISGTKREGDGATPSGVFTFGAAFGIGDDPGSAKPYAKVTENSLWVDDPGSKYYNRRIEGDVPDRDWKSAEKLSLETVAYKYAIAIDYNTDPVVPEAGSAIFLHCAAGGPTNGCVSVPEWAMTWFLGFIDENAKIAISESGSEPALR
ncbi:MAG: L,D-transpeptidase family protein [Synergistaceae bacterium]|nr:L,D-transpeptidase family protein [Synergistaceae bacterium]